MTATRTPPLAPADAELFAAARLRAARLQPYLATAVFSLVPIDCPTRSCRSTSASTGV